MWWERSDELRMFPLLDVFGVNDMTALSFLSQTLFYCLGMRPTVCGHINKNGELVPKNVLTVLHMSILEP